MGISREKLREKAQEKALIRAEFEKELNLEAEYVTSRYRVRIRKACVSCDHNETCATRKKFFKVTYSPILHPHPMEDKLHKCGQWTLKKGLENAGLGTGQIRSMKHMLDYLHIVNASKNPLK